MVLLQDVDLILKIFEKRNISSVAKSSYMGQSALSRRIKRVEEELGYTIFYRGRGDREVQLTEKGAQLIPVLYDMKLLYNSACDLRHLDDRKNLRIASTDGPFFLAIDSVVEKLITEKGNYNFELHTANYNECIEALIRESVDIAFVGRTTHKRDIVFNPVYEEDICLIAKEGFFENNIVSPEDLDLSKAVISPYSNNFMTWYANIFDQRRPLIQCDLNSELERFMLYGNLWSFAPRSIANDLKKHGVNTWKFTEEIPKRIIYYVLKKHKHYVAVEELLEYIKEELRGIKHIHVYE